MSTTATTTTTTTEPTHPFVTGAVGAITFAAAMFAGEAFDLNRSGDGASMSTTEWLVTAGLAVVGLVVGVAVGLRGWKGDPARLSTYALGLSLAAAATFVVFWSGWPSVLSAVAVGLAVEHRRRVGSFSPSTAIASGLGVLAFLATAYICVTG